MEVKIRDLSVHYEEVGSGKPILILHGWSVEGRSMMADFEPLFVNRPGWRRLYPDLMGHGQTAVPDWAQGPDDVLNVILEFMDTIAPSERFVVAGVSWGGYIASGIVHQRLKQIDGALFYVPALEWGVSPASCDVPAQQTLLRDPEFTAALQPGEEWLEYILVGQTRAALEAVRAWPPVPPQDPKILALADEKSFSFDPTALPEPFPAPALFLTARQDSVTGYKKAWSMLEDFPRATFVTLDRSGHLLNFEKPALARVLMSEWLDRVEEYSAETQQR